MLNSYMCTRFAFELLTTTTTTTATTRGPQYLGLSAPQLLLSPLEQSPIFSWIGPFQALQDLMQFGAFPPLIFHAFMHSHIYPPTSFCLEFGVQLMYDEKKKKKKKKKN